MRKLAVLPPLLLLCTLAPSQSFLRGFGELAFDTSLAVADYTDLAVGAGHVLARRSDGTLRAWGRDLRRQCRIPALGPSPIAALAAGSAHSVVLFANGTIVGFGDNSYGQCSAPALPAGVTYTKVAAGGARSLGLRSDGILEGWGAWSNPVPNFTVGYTDIDVSELHAVGLLADGRVVDWGGFSSFVVPPAPPGLTYTAVAAGSQVSLALRSDGAIVGAGNNNNGELNVPALPPGVTYVEVAAYENRVMARRSDGQVVTWGNAAAPAPALAPGLTYTKIGIAWTFAALRSDGAIVFWPENDTNPYCQRFSPSHPVGAEYRQIAAGSDWEFGGGGGHNLALDAAGGVVAWGSNLTGQCVVPPLPAGVQYVEVAAGCDHTVNIGGDILGSGHSLLRRSDGTVVAFGNNGNGQVAVPPGSNYVELAAGGQHSLLRRVDGSVVAFGNNGSLQCNVPPLPPGVVFVEIAAGFAHSLARRSDGAVVAWGSNSAGQCNVPPLPPGLAWVQMDGGRFHSAGLRSDGSVVCWGSNSHGQCLVPALPAGVVYVEVAAGGLHTVARRSDGTAVAFGRSTPDYYGSDQTNVPVPPPGLSIVEIAAGGDHSVARLGPLRSYVRMGSGCSGSLPASRLVPRDTPAIGASFTVRLFSLPADAAFVLLGFDATTSSFGPLPLALGAVGMPGCTAHVRDDAVSLVVGTGGQAVSALAIPDHAALVGVTFYQQALVIDPTAGNALGAVMSEAMVGTVGRR